MLFAGRTSDRERAEIPPQASSTHNRTGSALRLLLLCARLAQSVERQALNLMVVGSSPTVGVFQRRSTRAPHLQHYSLEPLLSYDTL